MKLQFVIPLFVFLFLFISPAFATSTLDYTHDIQDAMTYNYTPTTKYGNETAMNIMGWTGYEQRIYMLWDINDIPLNSTITSATLSIWQYASGPTGLENVTVFDTTQNWNEANITWNAVPTAGTGFDTASYTTGSGHWYNISVKNALQDAINDEKNMSIMIKVNATAAAGYTQSMYYTREYVSTSKRPYLTVTFSVHDCMSDCGDCGCVAGTTECYIPPIVGTYVDNSTPNTIKCVPYANCTNTTYITCPSGTVATQISPLYNFSNTGPFTPENSTWCSGCYFFNMLTGWPPHWQNVQTNCPTKPECNCYGIWCSNNIYATNLTNNSITEWSAGCFNPTTGLYANTTDALCKATTIENLTEKYCADCDLTNQTPTSCVNTSTTCYDAACNSVSCPSVVPATCESSFGGQLALIFAGTVGVTDCSLAQALLSIMASMSVGFVLLFYTRDSGQSAQAFMFGSLLPLVGFTLISWFPAWLMVILIVLSAFIMAKSLGIGGG